MVTYILLKSGTSVVSTTLFARYKAQSISTARLGGLGNRQHALDSSKVGHFLGNTVQCLVHDHAVWIRVMAEADPV